MAQALPIIIGLISAATTGVGLAKEIGGGGAPKPATPTPGETEAAAGKAKQNQIASLQEAFPGIQALTGGSLSPEAVLRLSELITGEAGQPGVGASEQDILKLLTGSSNPLPFLVTAGNNPSGGTTPTGLSPGGSP